jgi:hypothetical protein
LSVTILASLTTARCSSHVAKPIAGEAHVVRGNIDVCGTSFSMYPDVVLPSVAAVSSLATSNPCLVVSLCP